MLQIKPILLSGRWVSLEPLQEIHRNPLQIVSNDERIWAHLPIKALGDKFNRWFDKAIQGVNTGKQLPFIVRRLSDQAIIGTTRYYEIEHDHKRLSIGYTWYIPEVWGTMINPECKYLLLCHAFDTLQLNRVEFYTDSRNLRSRAAIKKLGAAEEGILRKHMVIEDNYVRDTVVFSIIASEWPSVKSALETRLKTF